MRTLNDYFLTAKIEDVSTAGQVYVPVPDDGRVIKVISALNGAIGTGDATLTVKTAEGTAGTITITQSGSAAGDVDTLEPTSNHHVQEGGTIEIETDGASTNTISVDLVLIVRR
jgi:hypothetical protein